MKLQLQSSNEIILWLDVTTTCGTVLSGLLTLGKLRTAGLEVMRAIEPVVVAKDTLLSLALSPVPEEEGERV